MKNLGTAKLKTFKVSRIAYGRITSAITVFHRNDEEGNCFVQLDKEQEAYVRGQSIKLIEITE
jgi:hypothetical protein